MIAKELILKLFDLFNMKRWNDFISPVPFIEMDKQAHKMIIAYVIAHIEVVELKKSVDYELLIEGAMIETLHRAILTDLRPSVSYQLMQEKRQELNEWIVQQLFPIVQENLLSRDRILQYLNDDTYAVKEKEILASAHFLSTFWEFQIIEVNNQFSTRLKRAKKEIQRKYIHYAAKPSVQRILLDSNLMDFIGITAELRFQERWAQALRVPKTSVLGHMYFVAMLSFFTSKEFNFSTERLYNNFFVSLFHDLPEIMIRDIASPIKAGIEGLDPIVKEQERKAMQAEIYPLLPPTLLKEFTYFIEDEFSNRVVVQGKREMLSLLEMEKPEYNQSGYHCVDGQLLKWCDDLAAFLEASQSIEYGITSKQLRMAKEKIINKYRHVSFKGVELEEIFHQF